ncbi:MAG: response regulator transcription factor [Gemmatimonadetes bacterium]|nr:response regulator transcription factor [Gemmatimonadota bacterium]
MPFPRAAPRSPDDGGAGAPIRVMIVDDHPIFRDGLAALLGLHPDLQLVAEAGDGARALELYREHRPDVTLMDLSMPVLGGAEAIARIVGEFPGARVIALTTYEGDADIHRALKAGARGYLLKDVVRNQVVDAIRAVHRGERVLPPEVAQRLAEFTPRVELTERELEVLAELAKGGSNRDIATAIGRTEATVKVHVQHILEKLGAADRTEAVTLALRRGIIHLD